jgi:hypothetical protein
MNSDNNSKSVLSAILIVRRTILYHSKNSFLTDSAYLKIRDDFISYAVRRTLRDCRHLSTLAPAGGILCGMSTLAYDVSTIQSKQVFVMRADGERQEGNRHQ